MSTKVAVECLSPELRYRHDLEQEGFSYDPSQEYAVGCLQSLYERLLDDAADNSRNGLIARLIGKLGSAPNSRAR